MENNKIIIYKNNVKKNIILKNESLYYDEENHLYHGIYLHFVNKKLLILNWLNNEKITEYYVYNNDKYEFTNNYDNIIPKIAFTYWSGIQFTYLHYLTIQTFLHYNKDYEFILYLGKSGEKTNWTT